MGAKEHEEANEENRECARKEGVWQVPLG